MKVTIIGDPSYSDRDHIKWYLSKYCKDVTRIYSRAGELGDIVSSIGIQLDIKTRIISANKTKYKKMANSIKDEEVLLKGDLILAFTNGKNKHINKLLRDARSYRKNVTKITY